MYCLTTIPAESITVIWTSIGKTSPKPPPQRGTTTLTNSLCFSLYSLASSSVLNRLFIFRSVVNERTPTLRVWCPSGFSSKERLLTGMAGAVLGYCCLCLCDPVRSLISTHVRIPAAALKNSHRSHFEFKLLFVQPDLCLGHFDCPFFKETFGSTGST